MTTLSAMLNPKAKYAQRHYETALDHFEKEQFFKALEQIRKAIAIAPENPDFYSTLGIFYHKMNDLAQAIEAYRKAISIKDNHTFAHFNLGLILMKLGRPAEAIKEWEAVLQEDPQGVDALFNIAVALAQIGRVNESIPFYARVLSLNPDHVQAHQNLGIIFRDSQQFTKARFHLLRLQKLDSTYAEVVEDELRKCEEMEFLQSLVQSTQEITTIDDRAPFLAPETRALAALLRGDFQTANQLIEPVINKDPTNLLARTIRGQTLAGLGQSEDAIALFTALTEEFPETADCFFHLGNIYLNLNLLEKALNCFEQVLRIEPTFPSIEQNVAFLRAKSNQDT